MDVRKLLTSLLICLGAGGIGGFFTLPNWFFGPVWTVLYIMMGVALYIVWNTAIIKHRVVSGIFWFTSYSRGTVSNCGSMADDSRDDPTVSQIIARCSVAVTSLLSVGFLCLCIKL